MNILIKVKEPFLITKISELLNFRLDLLAIKNQNISSKKKYSHWTSFVKNIIKSNNLLGSGGIEQVVFLWKYEGKGYGHGTERSLLTLQKSNYPNCDDENLY